jgi:hypothetical protein
MDEWRKVWREKIAPQISTHGLETLSNWASWKPNFQEAFDPTLTAEIMSELQREIRNELTVRLNQPQPSGTRVTKTSMPLG